jgi:hypothetical protein
LLKPISKASAITAWPIDTSRIPEIRQNKKLMDSDSQL